MILLPAQLDKCEACATKHAHDYPHNQQSLHWKYWFYGQHGRFPTWTDAMEHCTPEMKKLWVEALGKKGIQVIL